MTTFEEWRAKRRASDVRICELPAAINSLPCGCNRVPEKPFCARQFGTEWLCGEGHRLYPVPNPNELEVELVIRWNGEVRHQIKKSLTYTSAPGGEWLIRAAAPEFCRGMDGTLDGRGRTHSHVVLSWLMALCDSFAYEPYYRRVERRQARA